VGNYDYGQLLVDQRQKLANFDAAERKPRDLKEVRRINKAEAHKK
jgi:hypothetical protein